MVAIRVASMGVAAVAVWTLGTTSHEWMALSVAVLALLHVPTITGDHAERKAPAHE